MVKLNCTQCGKEFERSSVRKDQKNAFCSQACSNKWRTGRPFSAIRDARGPTRAAMTQANQEFLQSAERSRGGFEDAIVPRREPRPPSRPATQTGAGQSSAALAAAHDSSSGRIDKSHREMPPEIALAPLRSVEAR